MDTGNLISKLLSSGGSERGVLIKSVLVSSWTVSPPLIIKLSLQLVIDDAAQQRNGSQFNEYFAQKMSV